MTDTAAPKSAALPAWVDSLPRPLLRWVCVPAAAWALGLGDVFGLPIDNTARGIVLAFIGAVYGIREFGKVKGLS